MKNIVLLSIVLLLNCGLILKEIPTSLVPKIPPKQAQTIFAEFIKKNKIENHYEYLGELYKEYYIFGEIHASIKIAMIQGGILVNSQTGEVGFFDDLIKK